MAKFDIGRWRATVDLGASASASICGALFFLEAPGPRFFKNCRSFVWLSFLLLLICRRSN